MPPAAAAAWRAWFEARHPGLRALPVSAARGCAAEAQRDVLAALLETRVWRRGGEARVADVVGLGLGGLLSGRVGACWHAGILRKETRELVRARRPRTGCTWPRRLRTLDTLKPAPAALASPYTSTEAPLTSRATPFPTRR